MQSHEFAASTHPLPLQTSILEALNNTSAALRAEVKVQLFFFFQKQFLPLILSGGAMG